MNRKEFMAARSTERADLIKISCAEGDCKRDFVWEYLKKNIEYFKTKMSIVCREGFYYSLSTEDITSSFFVASSEFLLGFTKDDCLSYSIFDEGRQYLDVRKVHAAMIFKTRELLCKEYGVEAYSTQKLHIQKGVYDTPSSFYISTEDLSVEVKRRMETPKGNRDKEIVEIAKRVLAQASAKEVDALLLPSRQWMEIYGRSRASYSLYRREMKERICSQI